MMGHGNLLITPQVVKLGLEIPLLHDRTRKSTDIANVRAPVP